MLKKSNEELKSNHKQEIEELKLGYEQEIVALRDKLHILSDSAAVSEEESEQD